MSRLPDTIKAHKVSGTAAITAIVIATSVSGCDAVVDCLDNDGPTFSSSQLQNATLNQEYIEDIEASVKNEPFDDRFDYEFSVLRGALPAGLTAEQRGRSFVFSGTPTELGVFTIRINVEVDDGLNALDSGLCFRNRSRDFTLTVEQDNT